MTETHPILLFDGVCNLCNGLVKFIIKRDKSSRIRFAPLQSDAGKSLLTKFGLNTDEINSVVYVSENQAFLRSFAILRLFKDLGGGWKLFYGFIIIPSVIRDFFYNVIARTRYRIFGRSESCMIPTPEIRRRFLS